MPDEYLNCHDGFLAPDSGKGAQPLTHVDDPVARRPDPRGVTMVFVAQQASCSRDPTRNGVLESVQHGGRLHRLRNLRLMIGEIPGLEGPEAAKETSRSCPGTLGRDSLREEDTQQKRIWGRFEQLIGERIPCERPAYLGRPLLFEFNAIRQELPSDGIRQQA